MQIMLLLICLKLVPLFVLSTAQYCDRARTAHIREGNLGQSAHFNYIGVLIVQIREFDDDLTLMTGLVLIKDKYALADADDVVKIPQAIFKKNARAMFLPARNTPRFLKPSSYVSHPEYPHSTLYSIVIIELNLPKVDEFPLTPICLPTARRSHTSRSLYLAAITDDNLKLEKILYKIQHLEKKTCVELYLDNGTATVPPQELSPAAYSCGYAPNIARVCFWENGMALVSNATGVFNLIGLAVYGPGCEVPSRFLDLSRYLSWIHSVTRTESNNGDDFWRSKAATTTPWNKPVPNFPMHLLLTERRQNLYKKHDYEPYPFDRESLEFHIIKPTNDDKSILITTLDDKWERNDGACEQPRDPIYKEYFEVRALDKLRGSVTYKLSLYDLQEKTFACIRLTILCKHRSSAILSFKEEIVNYKENIELRDQSGETPEELFKYFPVLEGSAKQKHKGYWKEDDDFYRPEFLNDEDLFYSRNVINCDLFIKFEFNERATMQFEMFAESDVLNKSHIWKQDKTTLASSTETTLTPTSRIEKTTIPAHSTETTTTLAYSTKSTTTPASSTKRTTRTASSTEMTTTTASSIEKTTTTASSTERTTTPAPSKQRTTTPAPTTETTTTPASSTETTTTPAPSTKTTTTTASSTEKTTTTASITERTTTPAPSKQRTMTPASTTETTTTPAPTTETTTAPTTETTTTQAPTTERTTTPAPTTETTTTPTPTAETTTTPTPTIETTTTPAPSTERTTTPAPTTETTTTPAPTTETTTTPAPSTERTTTPAPTTETTTTTAFTTETTTTPAPTTETTTTPAPTTERTELMPDYNCTYWMDSDLCNELNYFQYTLRDRLRKEKGTTEMWRWEMDQWIGEKEKEYDEKLQACKDWMKDYYGRHYRYCRQFKKFQEGLKGQDIHVKRQKIQVWLQEKEKDKFEKLNPMPDYNCTYWMVSELCNELKEFQVKLRKELRKENGTTAMWRNKVKKWINTETNQFFAKYNRPVRKGKYKNGSRTYYPRPYWMDENGYNEFKKYHRFIRGYDRMTSYKYWHMEILLWLQDTAKKAGYYYDDKIRFRQTDTEKTTPNHPECPPWISKEQCQEEEERMALLYGQHRGKTRSRPVSYWGVDNWDDYMVKEATLRLVVDVEEPREVQETQSAAHNEGAPGAVVMTCWLISSCLRRAFFIH